MATNISTRIVADRIEELPVPAETMELIGHEDDLDIFCARYASGNFHHAWLLTGPKGIGKATLAFRLAGYILRNPDPVMAPDSYDRPDSSDVMESRVAGGGHPNILHLTRPWDDRAKKFKSEITVDEVRKTIGFFGTTTGEAGWRVCIVDAADEMNRNSANALLKVLEEPPARTIFLVLSHAPGRLLPTIRSRCLVHKLRPLEAKHILKLVDKFAPKLGKNVTLSQQDKELVANLSGGSIRKALSLLSNGGPELHQKLEQICASPQNLDWSAIHSLATELAPRAKDEKFKLFLDLYYDHISKQVSVEAAQNSDLSTLAYWSKLWEKTQQSAVITDAYNLDRKQMILSLFERMRHAA